MTDRLILQALLQVLQPLLDPTFSEHSSGFRSARTLKNLRYAQVLFTRNRESFSITSALNNPAFCMGAVIDLLGLCPAFLGQLWGNFGAKPYVFYRVLPCFENLSQIQEFPNKLACTTSSCI